MIFRRSKTKRFLPRPSFWLAMLAVWAMAASAPAQIVVTGSYSSTEAYWTGGAGNNGTIGGNTDGTLTVAGGSVLNLKNAYFGSGTNSGTGTVTLTGSGSQILISSLLYVGNNTGTGNMTIADGGYLYTPNITYLGNGSSASGTMIIDGLGSLWQTISNVEVGYGGTGTLTLQNQGAFSGLDLEVGANSGSGTVNVLGSGATEHSTLTLSGALIISEGNSVLVSNGGQVDSMGSTFVSGSLTLEGAGSEIDSANAYVSSSDGAANAIVRDGATLTVAEFEVGTDDGSSGRATLSGAGTTVTATGSFTVGTGTAEVLDGATASAGSSIAIGSGSGDVGHVLVSGSGSELSSADRLFVGSVGTGTLEIAAGGVVNGIFGYLGSGDGGEGTVTVTGAGSQLNIADYDSEGTITRGNLTIGQYGTGRLYIRDGAVINTLNSYLANLSVAGSGTVEISGSGSQLNMTNDFIIGTFGTGSLLIEDGGYVTNSMASVGNNEGAVGYATVTGIGTEWSNRLLYVGRGGTGTFTVADGALVDVSTNVYIARWETGYGTATVTDAGSEWRQAGNLNVGYEGTGILHVQNGGLVTSGNGYLGYYSGSVGTVNVSGTGSQWAISGNLSVGVSGSGNLSISDGGSVTVGGLFDQTVDGSTVVDGGTLSVSHFNDSTATLGTISISDPVGNSAMTVGADDGVTSTFAGVIQDYSSGPGSVTKTGSNTVVLAGDNTYTGGTTISAGTLQLGNGGITGSILGDVTNDGTLVFNRSDEVAFSGTISGSGSVDQAGGGTLILTADQTYTGTTTISSGTLQLGDGGASGSLASNSIANASALVFDRSDDVTFGGVISGSGTVEQAGSGTLIFTGDNTTTGATTISAGTLQLGDGGTTGIVAGDIVNNGTLTIDRTDDFTFSGLISGTGDLAKLGTGGDLTLSAANTFSGTTTIEEGRIFLGNALALQNSTVELSRDYSLGLNGNSATLGALSGTGAIYVSGTQTLTVGGNGTDTTYSGSIQGDGGANFQKQGAGTMILTGTNTYTGTTTISAGTLQIGDGGTTGSIVGDIVNNASLVVNRSGTTTYAGLISGTGGLTKEGSGTLILADDNTTTGGTTITAGTLQLGDGDTEGSILGNVVISDSGTLSFNRLDLGFGGDISGAGGVTQQGPGELYFTGNLTYTGPTTINNGLLYVGSAAQFQFSTVNIGVDHGFSIEGYDAILGGLAGSGDLALGSQTITVGGNGENTVYSGVLSGNGGLTKAGTGTLTLTGANTYSGGTTIDAGTVAVADGDALGTGTVTLDGGTLSLTSATNLDQAITVNAGGGTLTATDTVTLAGDLTVDGTLTAANGLLLSGIVGGEGTFADAVTVSGTLAPGHSPGTMNFTDLTLTSAALVQIELAGYTQGTDYDFLNISGTATLDGTLELSFLNDFAPQVGDTFSIASWTSHSGAFTSIGGTYPTGYTFSATYSDTGLTLTTLTTSAVPEPGTWGALAGLAALGAATLRRPKRTTWPALLVRRTDSPRSWRRA